MTEEVKVRVRLDTRTAKSDLRDLSKEGARTSGKVSSSIRGIVRKGVGYVGLGAGVGTGMAAIRGATQSGFGDVISETFSPIAAQISKFILGDMPAEARASRAAREETTRSFAMVAGAQKWDHVPPSVRHFNDTIKGMKLKEEQGRDLFARELGGTSITKMIDKAIDAITAEIRDGFHTLTMGIFKGSN